MKTSNKNYRAKKSLGQNFLKSNLALKKIIEAGEIKFGDIILEIGPGKGALTEKLLEKVHPAVAGQAATGRSYSYKATLKLLEYLGITRFEDLPEYENALKKVEEFIKTAPGEKNG